MRGSTVIYRKELSEHLSSRRFPVMFILILLSGSSAAFMSAQSLAQQGLAGFEIQEIFLVLFSGAAADIPSFVYFMSILAPILGISLGFDAVNRELSSGSMVRLLSNPIYRDSVIIGKLAAGMTVIAVVIWSIVGVITGLDILLAGFGPSLDSALRIAYFALVATLYSGVWFSLSLFLSVVFRRVATSALVSLAIWILLSFFVYTIADIVASILVPLPTFPRPTFEQILARGEAVLTISRISPAVIFTEAANALLNPRIRTLGPIYIYSPELPVPAPLSVDDSLAIIWPHISALVAGIAVFSILAYIAFMRLEIRIRWE